MLAVGVERDERIRTLLEGVVDAGLQRGARAISLRQNRMAHASEILHQIAQSRLRFVEVPVNIEYSAYSLGKGQHITDALTIMIDLFARRLYR